MDNINLHSESEEILFLNSIKDDRDNLENSHDLSLLFKVWYFIKNLENNYAIFKKINSDTIASIN